MSAGARPVGRRRRGARGLSRRLRVRLNPRVVAAVIGVVVVLGAGFLWFRDSSLVAIKRVQVIGASGPDAGHIRAALAAAARNMTTMDVNTGQLHTAVAPFPDVKSLQVSTQFPHGMRIRVIEQIPVAVVTDNGRRIAVAGDGTLLHSAGSDSSLPVIPLRVPPGGPRLTGYALAEVQLLSDAPYQLLPRIATVTDSATHGLGVRLRNGPDIYFGDSSSLEAKWSSAAAVLADPGAAGASYIDVTDPYRPAAGTGSDGGAASSSASSSGATTSGASTTGASSTGASSTGASSTGASSTAGASSTGTAASTGATSTNASTAASTASTSTSGGVSTIPSGG